MFNEIYKKIDRNEPEFLIEFMFQLTIMGRVIHMEFEGEKAISAFQQLNEINHRVLNRIRDIGSEKEWCDREYLLNMVQHHIKLSPHISSVVAQAAKEAYAKLYA